MSSVNHDESVVGVSGRCEPRWPDWQENNAREASLITLAHIVNPVVVDPGSDLFVAQPITFETMKRAKAFSGSDVDVTLLSAQYSEDRPLVPADFEATTDLDRSLQDVVPGLAVRRLPFIKDILERLFRASEADYFVYTNVDIGVNVEFYDRVADQVRKGVDCFALRRRNIPVELQRIDQIPEMYRAAGSVQRGPDCFVFPRVLVQRFQLDDIVIGEPGVGRSMLCNLIRYGRRPTANLGDGESTFHIGNDGAWRRRSDDAGLLNLNNSLKLVETLCADTADEGRRALMEPHLEALTRMARNFRRAEQPLRDGRDRNRDI